MKKETIVNIIAVLIFLMVIGGFSVLFYYINQGEFVEHEENSVVYINTKIANYDRCLTKNNQTIIDACLEYHEIDVYLQYDRELFVVSVTDEAMETRNRKDNNSNTIWAVLIVVVILDFLLIIFIYETIESIVDKITLKISRRKYIKREQKRLKARELGFCTNCGTMSNQ